MTNGFVANAVLIECELLTFAPADLAEYTIFGCQLFGLLQSKLKMKLLEVEGGTCPSAP